MGNLILGKSLDPTQFPSVKRAFRCAANLDPSLATGVGECDPSGLIIHVLSYNVLADRLA